MSVKETAQHRPVRALQRGLDILRALNERSPLSITEISKLVRLPRTTTFRALETLRQQGYVQRCGAKDEYALAIGVRRLASGYDDRECIRDLSRPHLSRLGQELIWPLALTAADGASMVVLSTTDHVSPLAVERCVPGLRLPLLTTATGRAYLAFCSNEERQALYPMAREALDADEAAAHDAAHLEQMLCGIRKAGYASAVRTRRVSDEMCIAVPVRDGGRVLAVLAVRFAVTAVPQTRIVERFIPRLQAAALALRDDYLRTEEELRASRAGAPQSVKKSEPTGLLATISSRVNPVNSCGNTSQRSVS